MGPSGGGDSRVVTGWKQGPGPCPFSCWLFPRQQFNLRDCKRYGTRATPRNNRPQLLVATEQFAVLVHVAPCAYFANCQVSDSNRGPAIHNKHRKNHHALTSLGCMQPHQYIYDSSIQHLSKLRLNKQSGRQYSLCWLGRTLTLQYQDLVWLRSQVGRPHPFPADHWDSTHSDQTQSHFTDGLAARPPFLTSHLRILKSCFSPPPCEA